MKPTEAQIAERLPMWEALSEFFLDTALQPADYDRIAKILAVSRYTEEQIEEILTDEVCPVCRSNMLSPAGEWLGFDPNWLKEKIGGRFGKRPRFRPWFILMNRWMYVRHWKKAKARMAELRVV